MKAAYTPNRDDNNPAYMFQTTDTALLVAAACGAISLRALVMNELAIRGRDMNGDWVGFEKAKPLTEKPATHLYRGLLYHITGKEGTNIATGKPVWEYSHLDEDGEARLWLAEDGTVYED